jgi:hypothetical protein
MRVALAALALVISVSACAMQSPATSGPARSGYHPLRAYISPSDASGLGFYVNRPAHVAVFEIVPGRGSSLVYPNPGIGRMDGFVFGGSHHLGWGRRYNAGHYLPASHAMSAGPRFFFLVASEEPLDLDPIGAFGMGLHGSLGMQFASLNAYSSMERLATLVLPSTADDGSWTTDLYVHWPNVLYDSRSGRRDLVQVRCNGYSMLVPVRQIAAVRASLCGALDDSNRKPATPQPSDSAGGGEIVAPKRRQPLPKSQATELHERITSSTQLEEAERRRAEPRAGSREVNLRERSGGRAEPRAGSSEPRTRPAADAGPRAEPREPSARPPTRSGDTPRAEPRGRPSCDPCEQR